MYIHVCCCLMPDFFYSAGIQDVSHIPSGGYRLSSLSITKNWTNREALNQSRYCTLRVKRSLSPSANSTMLTCWYLRKLGLFFFFTWDVFFEVLCCVRNNLDPLTLLGSKWVALILHPNPHSPMWKAIIHGCSNSLNILTIVFLMRLTGIEIPSEYHYLLEIV